MPHVEEVAVIEEPGPTGGRSSGDSEEVKELEKVEHWQQGRTVLGETNYSDTNAIRVRQGEEEYFIITIKIML